jgi:MYXO-CTERM domain-containing protein
MGKCVDPGASDLCLTCDSGLDDAGIGDGGDASTGNNFEDSSKETGGCGCTTPGTSSSNGLLLLAAIGATVAFASRRRR